MTSDLVAAGIQYTMLDDFHFKNAGLTEDAAARLLPDRGRRPRAGRVSRQRAAALHDSLRRPAGDDRLSGPRRRASIPTRWSSSATTARSSAPGRKRKKHVYDDGWLARFFDLLVGQPELDPSRDHAGRGVRQRAAGGQDLSARGQLPRDDRMGAADRAAWPSTTQCAHEMEHDPRWPRIARFVRGGFWRNFKVKYPEADEMYCRMMMVSRRLQAARSTAGTRRRAGRAGPHGAVSRPVQLQLLARRVRRRLSAAPAQRRSITS